MIRPLFALPFFLLSTISQNAAPQDTPPASSIPADAAAMVNPVHATAESQARAKTMYGIDCALCHGDRGDGKGDVVADMKLTMNDWTASPSVLDGMKDGELFYVIKNGKGKMPPEAGRVKDDELWNLVIYIRSLGKK
jgi:mono/diheme cytochrome c family protein